MIRSLGKFNSQIDYTHTLDEMKIEFNKKWETTQRSPSTNLQNYDELTILGAGAFGKVKLVREKVSFKFYAAKELNKHHIIKKKQVTHIYAEKRVLQSVRFPFLISLEFSAKDNDCLYLGLPLCQGGDLFSYHRKVRKFSENQARFYAAQVLLGLEYLHNVKVIYRDLKLENIMLEKSGYLKITDFGFAKKVDGRTMTLCGTPEYLAPEIIKMKAYGNSVDYWAYGVLVFEFVSGKTPFSSPGSQIMEMYDKIVAMNYRMPPGFSDPLKDLVNGFLQVNVTKRLGCMVQGVNEIKNHSWFEGVNWFSILNYEVNPPYIPVTYNLDDISPRNADGKNKEGSKSNKFADIFEEF